MSRKFFIPIIAVFFLMLSVSLPLMQGVSYAEEEKFGGLGMSVAQIFDPDVENKMGSLVVLDVLEGTPAAERGIQKGDVITQIDGEPTKGKTFEHLILEKLRGKIGSKVDIVVERAGVKTPLNFNLTRVEITYKPEQKG